MTDWAGKRFHLSQEGRRSFPLRAKRCVEGVVVRGPSSRSGCCVLQFDDLNSPSVWHRDFIEIEKSLTPTPI